MRKVLAGCAALFVAYLAASVIVVGLAIVGLRFLVASTAMTSITVLVLTIVLARPLYRKWAGARPNDAPVPAASQPVPATWQPLDALGHGTGPSDGDGQ